MVIKISFSLIFSYKLLNLNSILFSTPCFMAFCFAKSKAFSFIFFCIRSSLPLLTAAFHFVWRTVVNLYLIWCRDNVIASYINIVIHHLDERETGMIDLFFSKFR